MDTLALIKPFIPIYIIIIGTLILLGILIKIKKEKYKKAGINEIDRMTGEEFETFCKTLLEKYNFKVKRTPKNADFGIDLIATKDNRKIGIQCKRWNKKVGVKAIQEAVAGMNYYKCKEAIVITNNYFTDNAKKLAQKNNVKLIDRNKLSEIIIKSKSK